jgi:hypothetical protein
LPISLSAEPAALVKVRIVESADGCVLGEHFTEQLLQRTAVARIAKPGEEALAIHVSLRIEEGVVHGRMTLRETNGSVTEREITGASCAEVTAALALVAAVILDPSISTSTSTEPRRHATTAPPEMKAESAWRFGVGPALGAEGAVAPEIVPSIAVVGEAELELGHRFSPRFSLSFGRTTTSHLRVQTSTATLRFTFARVSICPARWPSDATLVLRPCGLFEAGVLRGAGEATLDPGRANAPWIAPGGSVRADFKLWKTLLISLEGGAVIPLLRHEFYFDPDAPDNVAFEVPSAGATSRLGVFLQFE